MPITWNLHFSLGRVLAAALLVFSAAQAIAEIIPADRRITWQPGVPGGIPVRTTIFANVTQAPYNADKTGATDASAKIQQAINACPSGQVVYIPTGTYRLNSDLDLTKGIVLRGDGPSNTLLKSYANWHAIQIGSFPSAPVSTAVSGSPAKGATTLTVASTSSPSLSVGDFIVIDQINDGTEVVNVDDQSRNGGTRCLSQITRITAISGSTLTIDPALYHNYSSARSPEVWEVNQGGSMTINAGLEDLLIERVSPISQDGYSNIKFVAAAFCWLKNVESKNTVFWHVDFDRSFRCEVRDSFFNDGNFHGIGGFSYGVTFDNRSTAILAENNVFFHLRHSMVIKGGASGCVFGYNYSFNSFQNDHWLATDMFVHGAHATMNLFEGNYGTKIQGDYTHGSGSYNTYFRNYVTRVSNAESITGGRFAVTVDLLHTYYNFVGNVLGASGLSWTSEETGATRSTGGTYIWSWGFQWDGDTSRSSTQQRDTALRHGNYNAATQAVSWDATIPDQSIPASLYLSSKPSFFGASAWPAIGADLNPRVGSLPAKDRYDSGFATVPAAPTNLIVTP